MLKRILLTLSLFVLAISASAQTTGDSEKLKSLATRLTAFGKTIPQEKVFVHMDNTCYFLGDTIWFSVYSRQTNTDGPSSVSRVLYAELLDHDGYLVKRNLIEMKDGRGSGWFELKGDSSMFSGFYELRVYTRWQLNWGEFQHEHKKVLEQWFFNKTCAREYFRDYEKLYSRVFPVYNKPMEPGDYTRDMTLRLLQRYYSSDPDDPATPALSLYPEGGHLIVGKECRVAFEACMSDGQYLDGTLKVNGQKVETKNRGRGVFTLTPQPGETYKCTFTPTKGKSVHATLSPAESDGVALQVERKDDDWHIRMKPAGSAATTTLGVTVMHEGKLEAFHPLDELGNQELALPDSILPAGIHQVTVFDTEGHVYADRLFFAVNAECGTPPLVVQAAKDEYDPNERIELKVSQAPSEDKSLGGESISLSVADAYNQIATFDSGNILTEMLLGSEIRGFIPNPSWYFEKDDEEHQQALDLLMMTQGWRRFNWRDMAVSGEWEIIHPAEHAQIITGAVHKYEVRENRESRDHRDMLHNLSAIGDDFLSRDERIGESKEVTNYRRFSRSYTRGNSGKRIKTNERADSLNIKNENLRARMLEDGEKLKREVLVHGEFVIPKHGKGTGDAVQGDVMTKDGRFKITAPRYTGENCLFFLAASDTTKWKKNKTYQWIVPSSMEYPEYYVRISFPYPRYVNPYSHYMTHNPSADPSGRSNNYGIRYEGHMMEQLSVYSKHGGLRSYKRVPPVIRLDAYEAFNHALDIGMLEGYYGSAHEFGEAVGHSFVVDMGVERSPNIGVILDTIAPTIVDLGMNPVDGRRMYDDLAHIDSVYVYTDYAPRKEGSHRYIGADEPEIRVKLLRYPDRGDTRVTYRDRFMRLPGFSDPAEFYNPDYSKRPLPEGQKDYRRTLYWNPDLKLDENGEAHITLYNNSRTTHLSVEAEGQATDGTLLWGRE